MREVTITPEGRKFLEEARSRALNPTHTLHNQYAITLHLIDTGMDRVLSPVARIFLLEDLQDVGYITIITTN